MVWRSQRAESRPDTLRRVFRLDAVDANEWHVTHRNRDATSSRRNEAEETLHSRRLASIPTDSSVDKDDANMSLTSAAIAEGTDGGRGFAEWQCACEVWRYLNAVIREAETWKARAEKVLTTQKVARVELKELMEQGAQLGVRMEEQAWLDQRLSEADAWLAQADALSSSEATLDGLTKCVKQHARIGLLSDRLDVLQDKVARGQAWLEETRETFRRSGVELGSLNLILATDGAPLYCLCRQPDDLQRLMIACDACEVWFHISCLGISPAKAKGYMANEFLCPTCCTKQGATFAFEPRCVRASPKCLPGWRRAIEHTRLAEDLHIKIDEAELLRAAARRASLWQAKLLPTLLTAHQRNTTPVTDGTPLLGGAISDDEMSQW